MRNLNHMARGAFGALLAAAVCICAFVGTVYADTTEAVPSDKGVYMQYGTSGGPGASDGESAGGMAGFVLEEPEITQSVWESFLVDGNGDPLPVPEQKGIDAAGGPAGSVSVTIGQDMLSFADFTAPFMAVYKIDARKDGTPVYSDVVGIEIAADDTDYQSKTLSVDDLIPAGSDVTVSLLYAGPSYSLYSKHVSTLSWESVAGGNRVTARFALAYDFDNALGSGKVNPFHTDGSDEPGVGIVMPDTGGPGVGHMIAAGVALLLICIVGTVFVRYMGKDGDPDA